MLVRNENSSAEKDSKLFKGVENRQCNINNNRKPMNNNRSFKESKLKSFARRERLSSSKSTWKSKANSLTLMLNV